jgi:hypothetical protein
LHDIDLLIFPKLLDRSSEVIEAFVHSGFDFISAEKRAIEFFFAPELFRQDDPRYLCLTFLRRYRYDLLRFLEKNFLEERP